MINSKSPDLGGRKSLQRLRDGRSVLIQDSGGLSARFGSTKKTQEIDVPDERWRKAKDAMPTHDVVLDNSAEGFTLREKITEDE